MKGRKTTLLWVRDSRNTWISELKNGEKPELLRNAQLNLNTRASGTVKIYDPWRNRWSDATVTILQSNLTVGSAFDDAPFRARQPNYWRYK